MNSYYKIGILVTGVVLLGALLWFFLLRPEKPEAPANKDVNQILTELTGKSPNQFAINPGAGPQPPLQVEPTGVELQELSPEQQLQQVIRTNATRFLERWGTYSNETNLNDLRSLSDMMTPQLQDYIEDYIYNIRNDYPYQEGYYGITTKAAAASIEDFDPNSTTMTVLVGARREENRPDGEVRAFNQEARVEMVNSGGEWLVNSVYWLEE